MISALNHSQNHRSMKKAEESFHPICCVQAIMASRILVKARIFQKQCTFHSYFPKVACLEKIHFFQRYAQIRFIGRISAYRKNESYCSFWLYTLYTLPVPHSVVIMKNPWKAILVGHLFAQLTVSLFSLVSFPLASVVVGDYQASMLKSALRRTSTGLHPSLTRCTHIYLIIMVCKNFQLLGVSFIK